MTGAMNRVHRRRSYSKPSNTRQNSSHTATSSSDPFNYDKSSIQSELIGLTSRPSYNDPTYQIAHPSDTLVDPTAKFDIFQLPTSVDTSVAHHATFRPVSPSSLSDSASSLGSHSSLVFDDLDSSGDLRLISILKPSNRPLEVKEIPPTAPMSPPMRRDRLSENMTRRYRHILATELVTTRITVEIDVGWGNYVAIRGAPKGNIPLVFRTGWENWSVSWKVGEPLINRGPSHWVWMTKAIPAGEIADIKILVNDSIWQLGDNIRVKGGDDITIKPKFDTLPPPRHHHPDHPGPSSSPVFFCASSSLPELPMLMDDMLSPTSPETPPLSEDI
eukprot:TRINITY_DN8661_c0_g1_i1.p1 TRINITY_DN8661_c0_g1~~TRINITY_DN8661_c0_g1_i1.p1  ORF type:complete len:331 (-),score=4.48 TRINITY_DN8661_c0_g1_i1:48-1040(-)